jgi:hypothetical protein
VYASSSDGSSSSGSGSSSSQPQLNWFDRLPAKVQYGVMIGGLVVATVSVQQHLVNASLVLIGAGLAACCCCPLFVPCASQLHHTHIVGSRSQKAFPCMHVFMCRCCKAAPGGLESAAALEAGIITVTSGASSTCMHA